MKHTGTRQIETERLILRRYAPDDAKAIFDNWASDDEVTRFLMWPTHRCVQTSERVLNDWLGHYAEENYYHWAIVPKELGVPVGDIAVVRQDELTLSAHIGYCIGRKWWRKGITSEALAAVIEYLFAAGFRRIDSRHDPRNPHSGGVMRKCGMTYEGTLRRSDWNNQGICDAAWYAILAGEKPE
ncbi:MAG: GNAT family N-acetyltransferase [Oscillospiraceae bacterium]|nr:GNAT family N-acetyltransferase [Oscillospiraceae bacterium]